MKKFGRLETIAQQGQKIKCQCECGNVVLVLKQDLESGNTKSCGCLRKEVLVKRNKDRATSKVIVSKAIALRSQGLTYKEIANKLNLDDLGVWDYQRVKHILKPFAIPKKKGSWKISSDEVAMLASEKKSLREIAFIAGVSHETIRKILANINPRI